MPRKINYAAINPDRVKELEYIDQQLKNAGYGYIQRLAILGNVQQESLGNPLAISSNGAWHGLIQWNKDRYRLQNRDAQDELQRQTSLLLKELEKTGWSGATWRDQLNYAQTFKDSTDLKEATDIFTRRFVRPANIESEIDKRFGHAQRGWMDEEPEEVKLKPLPENLTPIGNPILLNNKVVDTSPKKGIVKKEQPKLEIVRKPLNEMTEDDIRTLIYNSFKYQQGGNLIYHEFNQKRKEPSYKKQELDYRDFYIEDDKFPVESPVIYNPVDIEHKESTQPVQEEYQPAPLIPKGVIEYKQQGMDVGNMQELIDLMRDEGISFRITSGNRPGALTSKGTPSHHGSGNALDITPIQGQTWDDLINQMKNSKKFISYMNEHKLGILDERSKKMQAQTGGTGAHFHIGPDKNAIINFKYLIG